MKKQTKFLKRSIFITLLIVSVQALMAQSPKLAGFSVTRFPGASVTDSPLNREIEVNEYKFFVNLPVELKNDKTILINGLQYKLVTPTAYNDVALNIDGQNLHVIGYSFTAVHKLKNNWRALVVLSPTLSSTFNQSLEGDDFLLNGTLQFIKKKSEKFSYGGGILATSRFGDPIILPSLQLAYKTDRSKFQVVFPRGITYERYYGKLTAGLKAEVDGSLYNVNYSRTSPLDEVQPVNKVGYTRVVLGSSVSYRVGKVIQLEASGGISAAQSIELQGDLFEDERYDLDNGTFFQIGVSIVPPKKDTN